MRVFFHSVCFFEFAYIFIVITIDIFIVITIDIFIVITINVLINRVL